MKIRPVPMEIQPAISRDAEIYAAKNNGGAGVENQSPHRKAREVRLPPIMKKGEAAGATTPS